MKETSKTPMMKQYEEIKSRYSDSILMFRLGDFYEMFGDDAIVASKVLGIVLTGRDAGMEEKLPMCGVPYHSVDSYIATLIENGFKVAIANQTEDPKQAKGIVKREVTRVITRGTYFENVDAESNNFVALAHPYQNKLAFAYCDISTGEFKVTSFEGDSGLEIVLTEISRIQAKELIICDSQDLETFKKLFSAIDEASACNIVKRPSKDFEIKNARNTLIEHFNVSSLEGYALSDESRICASGALLKYLKDLQMNSVSNVDTIRSYDQNEYMSIDPNSRRNLEITDNISQLRTNKDKNNNLLSVLNATKTSCGARALKNGLQQPLLNKTLIQRRLDLVEELYRSTVVRTKMRDVLKNISDIERLCARLANKGAGPRELVALKNSLISVGALKTELVSLGSNLGVELFNDLDDVKESIELINIAIKDEPPSTVDDAGVLKDGYNAEVDELRRAHTDGKRWILEEEAKERENTGIKSLKVGYNSVFGYYIEVTKSNLNQVPSYYIRKQTLANAERYITPELKEIENKVMGAEDKLIRLEKEIFAFICEEVTKYLHRMLKTASAIAYLDMLGSFAEVAVSNRYVRPHIVEESSIHLVNVRHPVLETRIGRLKTVSNNIDLDVNDARLIVLTGPNMAGKSTVLSTLGMICVMAQAGSFVPADEAIVGVVDRIFYRTGSYDDISSGKSTFMVELLEMANIINTGTSRSLVLVDELGRGTSTYDGMALAWAIAEYLHDTVQARTIFTTHYHELSSLEGKLSCARNFHVGAKENSNELIFLYKLLRGNCDKSYGINVARMAGLPKKILKRAETLLKTLEKAKEIHNNQQTLFGWTDDTIYDETSQNIDDSNESNENISDNVADSIVDTILNTDVSNLTPVNALILISSLKELLTQDKEK